MRIIAINREEAMSANITMNNYSERMSEVIDYLYANLDENLTLDQLCEIANFSKFHFHRQFSAYTGIPLYKLIQKLRLKKSAYQLFFHHEKQVTEIAFEAGFESLESFSRAFKKYCSQTPSEFRSKQEWMSWLDEDLLKIPKDKKMENIKIVDFREVKIAVLKHRGPEKNKNKTVLQFINWRKNSKFHPSRFATYNLIYDNIGCANQENFDQKLSKQEEYRFDVASEVDGEISENDYGVTNGVIPSCRCALLRHIGSWNNIEESISHLYGDWLPKSGEKLKDFPCFIHRVNLFPETPENKLISDIYLPLE